MMNVVPIAVAVFLTQAGIGVALGRYLGRRDQSCTVGGSVAQHELHGSTVTPQAGQQA